MIWPEEASINKTNQGLVDKGNPSGEGYEVAGSEADSTNHMAAHKQVGIKFPWEGRIRVSASGCRCGHQ